MKVVKGIFYAVMALILAGCLGILVCALNPSLTKVLAEKVDDMTQSGTGGGQASGQEGDGLAEGDGQPEAGQNMADWLQDILPGIGSDDGSQSGGGQTGSGLADAAQGTDVYPGISTDWIDGRNKAGYEVPDEEPEQIPDSVSGRSGYESVQEEAQEVGEEEAGDLAEGAEEGATGSDLEFDEAFYPYYAMLEENLQRLYRQIYANALECTETFAPVEPVSAQRLKTVFEAVYNDHPELFWLQTGYACKYIPGGSCVEVTLKYNDTAEELERAREEFDAAAERILAGAESLGSEYEKERYVHDALMLAVEYDLGAERNQSAYSALVDGRSVCAGYARAFQYLMQELGVPCYYCTGYAGEDHAWNIVKLGDGYYNVDVTWDDTDEPTYDYFNKSDKAFGSTHRRTGLSVYLPACREEGEEGLPGEAASGDLSGQDSAEGAVYISDVSDYINPNPAEPLRWQSKAHVGDADVTVEDTGLSAEEKKQANLEQAGLTEDQVRETLEEYYADCGKLLKEAGTGDKQYINVVPEELLDSVERAYSSGDYWNGYVEDALKELGVSNFLIQLQVQRLGGGYCRIYHNVLTY